MCGAVFISRIRCIGPSLLHHNYMLVILYYIYVDSNIEWPIARHRSGAKCRLGYPMIRAMVCASPSEPRSSSILPYCPYVSRDQCISYRGVESSQTLVRQNSQRSTNFHSENSNLY